MTLTDYILTHNLDIRDLKLEAKDDGNHKCCVFLSDHPTNGMVAIIAPSVPMIHGTYMEMAWTDGDTNKFSGLLKQVIDCGDATPAGLLLFNEMCKLNIQAKGYRAIDPASVPSCAMSAPQIHSHYQAVSGVTSPSTPVAAAAAPDTSHLSDEEIQRATMWAARLKRSDEWDVVRDCGDWDVRHKERQEPLCYYDYEPRDDARAEAESMVCMILDKQWDNVIDELRSIITKCDCKRYVNVSLNHGVLEYMRTLLNGGTHVATTGEAQMFGNRIIKDRGFVPDVAKPDAMDITRDMIRGK